jgi:hypothetical protein
VNAFTDLAERQISAPVKARQRAAEKRVTRKQEKALAERAAQFRNWKREQRERIEALLAGPYGGAAQAPLAFLDTLALDQAPALVALVKAGPWREADADTRYRVLSLISAAIVAVREQHDLPPFDDPLPPRTNAFLTIRSYLSQTTTAKPANRPATYK